MTLGYQFSSDNFGLFSYSHWLNFYVFLLFHISSVRNLKAGAAGVNASKAQEDLAKARKLIKSMRSLEKSASKSSQTSTEDNGSRLHQVASSNKSTDKEGSQRYVKIQQCWKLGKNPGCPNGKCRTFSGNWPIIWPKNWLPEQNFSCLRQPGNH